MHHIPALWYFDISVIYPIDFVVKFVIIPPCFLKQQHLWNIAIQPGIGCHDVWANTRWSGCSPLEEKSLLNGTIDQEQTSVKFGSKDKYFLSTKHIFENTVCKMVTMFGNCPVFKSNQYLLAMYQLISNQTLMLTGAVHGIQQYQFKLM